MTDKIKSDKIQNSQNLVVESLNSLPLISITEHSNKPWVIRDCQSRYVYVNQAGLDFLGLPANFNIEGKLDNECPADWAEFAAEYQANDRKAEKTGKRVAIISTNFYGRKKILEPYYLPRFLIYNKLGECIGTLTNASKLNFISLSQYVNQRTPSVLTLTPPTTLFTEKELRVIFFILQPMTAKMVGDRLCRAKKTIENNLRIIYDKAGVSSLKDFREWCGTIGLDLYIPPEFAKPRVQSQSF
ncbi:GerE domain-containing putative transcriptional regulator [Candidatus Regiella insecticola LSR1]|uniref:GerE domain-containing putative transcriptional regulator n=1 Tax=Candidatus Regiella insecticola LSR1 TaxID=663321 RepID=E0WQL5_9ENTR|nr:PAS domain-containing protein [Candidatus Regiella insecticola]EFL92425.1 GerE domain-containing putative transcriptional regulator [Candidatus Regiella insecticola LSR1]